MATSTQSVQSRFGPALVLLEGVLSLYTVGVLVDELLGDMVDNWRHLFPRELQTFGVGSRLQLQVSPFGGISPCSDVWRWITRSPPCLVLGSIGIMDEDWSEDLVNGV